MEISGKLLEEELRGLFESNKTLLPPKEDTPVIIDGDLVDEEAGDTAAEEIDE